MPLFARSSSGGSSFFQKVKSVAGKAIGSVGRLGGGVARIASRAGDILGTLRSVADSPLAQQIVGYVAPSQLGNLNKVQNALSAASNITATVGSIGQKTADITSPGTYYGQNPVPAARNAVERAKDIRNDVSGLIGGDRSTYTPMAFR